MNISDRGFLYDPDSEYAKYVETDVVSFDRIAHLPCLALLGEPGIGKSVTMEALRKSVQLNLQDDECLLFINLNEYGDESRLIHDLFVSPEFTTWADGSHVLHLFLDSLDECRIQIPKVGTIIKNRLCEHRNSLPRLRFRIACRTADWPGVLENSLPDIWGKESYGAFELAPLRRQDMVTAAKANGIDATDFLKEIDRTDTSALANKPITLEFLLACFSSNGRPFLTTEPSEHVLIQARLTTAGLRLASYLDCEAGQSPEMMRSFVLKLLRDTAPLEGQGVRVPEPVIEHPISDTAGQNRSEPSAPPKSTQHAHIEEVQFGGPEEDPFDPRVVRWYGKRLYLGPEGSQVRELFMLLARKPGVPHSLFEVQLAVDGTTTMRDTHGEDAFRKMKGRIAKALSKLRKQLRENDLDDHVVILKEGPRDESCYTLISRFGNS